MKFGGSLNNEPILSVLHPNSNDFAKHYGIVFDTWRGQWEGTASQRRLADVGCSVTWMPRERQVTHVRRCVSVSQRPRGTVTGAIGVAYQE